MRYEETLIFELKNYDKVKENYKDYRKKEFNQLMEKHKTTITMHFKDLQNDIEKKFLLGDYKYFFENLDLDTKMDVRFLKTNVNHACRYINTEMLESIMLRPNKDKINCFAIKFYLKYYKKINKIMTDTLLDMVKAYHQGGE